MNKKKVLKVAPPKVSEPQVQQTQSVAEIDIMNYNKSTSSLKGNKIAIDMMHYKPNRASFWLILLTIALNVAMFIIIYKTNTSAVAADLQLGFDLIINVTFMLACFLAAEKTKRYSKEWGITSIVLGGLEAARIFWIPLYYYLNGGISVGSFIACIVLLAGAGAGLIFGGLICLAKYKLLQDHAPLLDGYLVAHYRKATKPVVVKKKKSAFTNISYKKKTAPDSKFDEYVVTFTYKRRIIPYYMFFLKTDHVSMEMAKKEFYMDMQDGTAKRYARAFMLKCGSALEKVKGAK